MSDYFILSMNGGGYRGLATLVWLEYICDRAGKHPTEIFDMICGASIGGNIALALSRGMTPKEIRLDMEANGKKIFPKTPWRLGIFDEKYPNGPLLKTYREKFGSAKLGSLTTPTFVTAYELKTRKPKEFRSWDKADSHYSLVDVAYATAAAPTYFEVAIINGEGYIDGGVYAGNPSALALAEARVLGHQRFTIVNLGTGRNTRPMNLDEVKDWGGAEYIKPLFSIFIDAQNSSVVRQLSVWPNVDYYYIDTDLITASDDMDVATKAQTEALKIDAAYGIKENKEKLTKLIRKIKRVRK
jgi:uncharacterized protein